MKKILIAILIFMLSLNAYAQNEEGGTESNLSLGFGARALSLGQAFTAAADDPTAVFWNPAGLEHVYQQSVSLFHATLFEGTLYDFLGYAYPTLRLGTFGFGIARIGIGGVPHTGIDNESLGSDISLDEYQGFFSYAKRLPWDITAGLTVRAVRRAWTGINGEKDTGIGMDFGLLYKPQLFSASFLQDWTIGLNIINAFAPQLNEGQAVDVFPLGVRFGVGKKIYMFEGGSQLQILFDTDYSANRDVRFHFGTEYKFRDLGALRVGFDGFSPTFGAGMRYSIFQIDYAFGRVSPSDYFSSVHQFSLSFNFGLNRNQLLSLAAAERKEEEDRLIADIREADRQKFIAEHLKNADNYFNESKYFDAIVEYQQVIGQDAFNKRATVMLDSSESLFQNQREKEQSLAVQSALNTERTEATRAFIEDHFNKGRLYLDKKQFTEALIEFNMARDKAPQEVTILAAIQTTKRRMSEETNRLVQQGRQEFRNGNYAKALGLLADARLLGGDNPVIQTEIETLSKRIKLQEDIQKGIGLFDIGEYDQAVSVFEEALKLNPDSKLAKQYYEKSKIETVGKSEPLDAAAEGRYLRGVDKFVKGKYQEAVTIWEKLLKEHPYNKKILKALEGARDRLNRSK